MIPLLPIIAPVATSLVSCTISSPALKKCNEWGKTYYLNWWNELTKKDFNFNLDNLYCDTEIQALTMYIIDWGDFWNYYLHHQQNPPNQLHKMQGQFCENKIKNIRGNDYHLISQALNKAPACPENIVLYHGVEYMEDEFYDQLKNYIRVNDDGTYNYSNCIGKTIKSYGFLSATFDKPHAFNFSTGKVWTTDKNQLSEIFSNSNVRNNHNLYHLPLKSPVAFKINVPKDSKNIAYVSGMAGSNGYKNNEYQVLIDKDTNFRIDNIHTEYNSSKILVTIFDVTYLGK